MSRSTCGERAAANFTRAPCNGGPALDKSSHSPNVIKSIFGTLRCMWGDIMKLAEVNPDDLSTGVHVPSSSSVVREICEGCKLHGKNANCPGPHAADSRDIGSRDYSVDIATFPCPPFSRQGNMLGEKDPRFRPYVAMVVCIRKRRPDIVILENVIGADPDMPERSFGDIYDTKVACVDPRIVSGVKMARERLIWVLLLRATMRWMVEYDLPLRELLEIVIVGRTQMDSNAVFVDPDAECFVAMRNGQAILTDRQTDGRTDRQTDRQTDKQTLGANFQSTFQT